MNTKKLNHYLFSIFSALFLCMDVARAAEEHWVCDTDEIQEYRISFGYKDSMAYVSVNDSVSHTTVFSLLKENLASISMCHNAFYPNPKITIKKHNPNIWMLSYVDQSTIEPTELYCTKTTRSGIPAETPHTTKRIDIGDPLIPKKDNACICCAVS